jgi:hypothetical protein
MYANITEFIKTLELAGLSERKENSKVHTVTLRSFRSFVKSAISDITGRDYSEWFIGHKDPCYKKNKQELRDIYKSKCMKYLTFLDYTFLEARGKSTEANLLVKDQEIRALREQTRIMSKQLADVIEQQQQHANTFDMKFVKLLDIVKTGLVDQEEVTRSVISREILKMMPRKLTTKELQRLRHIVTSLECL